MDDEESGRGWSVFDLDIVDRPTVDEIVDRCPYLLTEVHQALVRLREFFPQRGRPTLSAYPDDTLRLLIPSYRSVEETMASMDAFEDAYVVPETYRSAGRLVIDTCYPPDGIEEG